MRDYRMLVLDLDGTTLTGPDHQIAPRDRAAVAALLARGVAVTIATGRLFSGSQWVAEALGLRGSIAVMDGSELVDAESGAVRSGRYLEPRAREEIRARLRHSGLATFVFGSREIHYGAADTQLRSYLGIWTDSLLAHRDVFAVDWPDDTLCVGAVGEEADVHAALAHLDEALGHPLGSEAWPTSRGHFLTVRDRVENKGTAVGHLARERGIDPADTVAIGDWVNDHSLLSAAGLGFAMGHAPESVRRAADHVLRATRKEGGGIAEVARRVWGVEV